MSGSQLCSEEKNIHHEKYKRVKVKLMESESRNVKMLHTTTVEAGKYSLQHLKTVSRPHDFPS